MKSKAKVGSAAVAEGTEMADRPSKGYNRVETVEQKPRKRHGSAASGTSQSPSARSNRNLVGNEAAPK